MSNDNNTSKIEHVIKLFTVSKEQPVRIMSGDQELACPNVQLPNGVYELSNGSYLFHGEICLYQDGEYYDLYALPDNMTIYGDLNLSGMGLRELPDCFKKIMVLGEFNCSYNFLKDLRNSPKYVKKYNCSANLELTSLYGATGVVSVFDCSTCPRLENLEYIPQAKVYYINGNPQLTYMPSGRHSKQSLSKYYAKPGAPLFEILPDEIDELYVQDGPAHIDISGKHIKFLDLSFNHRRKDLADVPANTDTVIYNNCNGPDITRNGSNLPEEAIKDFLRRKRVYLELQRQTEIEFQ